MTFSRKAVKVLVVLHWQFLFSFFFLMLVSSGQGSARKRMMSYICPPMSRQQHLTQNLMIVDLLKLHPPNTNEADRVAKKLINNIHKNFFYLLFDYSVVVITISLMRKHSELSNTGSLVAGPAGFTLLPALITCSVAGFHSCHLLFCREFLGPDNSPQ